ncbi:putative Zinc finger, SWIM-type, MULE transposase domain, FHY3/FAR1 family [Helianthus debilis subsp. tardiflorus]
MWCLLDATYKTNKYNLPFLEIVGVISTNKTFSIAFAFMNKEKANNYIWALTRLKLTINDSFCPRVIVTDRDLALMKACAEVFPQSNHLLCRWHIQNDIIKHCRPRIRSQETWVHFLWMWNTLVASPTNTAYMQNYDDLQALLIEYPGVLHYLQTTWLDNYAERFVSLWTDKHINFGNSTTNRVESQHTKLKKHLDTAKCDLDRFIHVIEDIVSSQETAIKDSIERSRHIRKKKYNYPTFQQLHDVVSHHAMKIILAEIHRSRDFVLTVDNCGCQIRSCFGLPCAHELAMYVSEGLAIPFDCIDPFWTKLDLLPSVYVEYGDLGYEKDMKLFKETFNKQSKPVKSSLLRKLRGIFDPSTNLIVEPVVKKNNRGRPKKKHVNPPTRVSHRHNFSNFGGLNFEDIKQEPARHSSYMWDMNEEPVDNIPYSSFQSFFMHPLMEEIPKIFHPYVTHIEDVVGDGNCGFRAIAACLRYGEDQWLYVKGQLLHELLDAYIGYETVLTSGISEVHLSLLFSQSPAPRQHWMVMPETGILIANKFGVVLNCLSNQGCIT